MRMTMLGAIAGIALLPAITSAQTPYPTPTPTPTPPPAPMPMPTTSTKDTTAKQDSIKIQGSMNQANPVTGTNSGTTNSGTSVGTTPLTTDTTSTPVTTTVPLPTPTPEPTPAPLTTPTTTTTTTTTTVTTPEVSTSSSTSASVSSSGAMPASGSAFAMGTHSAARDSMVGPRPEPPGDGTTCPWGCPTSKGTAGLTGPQFLALQQELRDRKCGNSHVTGRLDAATRVAIRNCAQKMGVANNAAAVLVGFDIGFSASDVNSGSAPKQEE